MTTQQLSSYDDAATIQLGILKGQQLVVEGVQQLVNYTKNISKWVDDQGTLEQMRREGNVSLTEYIKRSENLANRSVFE